MLHTMPPTSSFTDTYVYFLLIVLKENLNEKILANHLQFAKFQNFVAFGIRDLPITEKSFSAITYLCCL